MNKKKLQRRLRIYKHKVVASFMFQRDEWVNQPIFLSMNDAVHLYIYM